MSWLLRDLSAIFQSNPSTIKAQLAKGPSIILHRADVATDPTQLNVVITPRDAGTAPPQDPLELGEAYVRENDLIATYPETTPWRFGYQMDLRCIEPPTPNFLCLEIWLSVQTSLLDSHPQLDFRLTGDQFQSVSRELWVGHSHRYCLAIHPLDQPDCSVRASTDELHMTLFGRFIEKGVIRRLRLRLMAAATPCDHEFWNDRMQEFSGSPLPLTT